MAVGYTADAYIIKNSWGTIWGLNGYALVSRTASSNCQILDQAHIVKNKPAFEWKMLTSLFILAIILVLS
jgi:C1A family cysteine protease